MYTYMLVHAYSSVSSTYILQKKLPSNALATSLAEGGQALGQDSLLGYDRHDVVIAKYPNRTI